jgi:hypothetical protein
MLRLTDEAISLRTIVAPDARPELARLELALLPEFGACTRLGRLLLVTLGRTRAEHDGKQDEQSARYVHCDVTEHTRSRCARVRFTQRPSMRKCVPLSSCTRRDPLTLT